MNSRKEELVDLILSRLDTDRIKLGEIFNNRTGANIRNFVIDDVLPEPIAWAIYEAFPKGEEGMLSLNSFKQRKRTSISIQPGQFNPLLQDIAKAFQDSKIVQMLAEITGIQELEPEPVLHPGAFSIMAEGDFVNPHIDVSHDRANTKYRRLNLLFYVSPNWALENGGNLELWDERIKTPKTIVSRFNRLAVMETHRTSWHSVSRVRVSQYRYCLNNYYYSKNSPDSVEYRHVSHFWGRPEQPIKRAISPLDNNFRELADRAYRGVNRIASSLVKGKQGTGRGLVMGEPIQEE